MQMDFRQTIHMKDTEINSLLVENKRLYKDLNNRPMNGKVLELERKIKELEAIIDTQKKATEITYIKKIKDDAQHVMEHHKAMNDSKKNTKKGQRWPKSK